MKLQLLSLLALALAHRGFAAIAVAPSQPADHKHDEITYEQHSSSQIKLLQTPQFETTGYNQASCNKWPNDYVCACDGNLGIKYGHCYTMTDINGLQLNRDTGGTYQSGGDIGNLIFKVCKSTKDCNEAWDTPVPEDGTWVLQDQLGDRVTPGPGWFANILPHMMVTPAVNSGLAAVFTGEPFYFFGGCSLCLRLAAGPYRGISSPCPLGAMANMAHLGAAINPVNCKAYRFQEISCVKGVK